MFQADSGTPQSELLAHRSFLSVNIAVPAFHFSCSTQVIEVLLKDFVTPRFSKLSKPKCTVMFGCA